MCKSLRERQAKTRQDDALVQHPDFLKCIEGLEKRIDRASKIEFHNFDLGTDFSTQPVRAHEQEAAANNTSTGPYNDENPDMTTAPEVMRHNSEASEEAIKR